jgi:hypothetical protein
VRRMQLNGMTYYVPDELVPAIEKACAAAHASGRAEGLKRIDSPALLEELAAIEHERWSGWEKYRELCVEQVRRPGDNETHVDRWRRQRETHYDALSEREKESDRIEARKSLHAIRRALAGGEGET